MTPSPPPLALPALLFDPGEVGLIGAHEAVPPVEVAAEVGIGVGVGVVEGVPPQLTTQLAPRQAPGREGQRQDVPAVSLDQLARLVGINERVSERASERANEKKFQR